MPTQGCNDISISDILSNAFHSTADKVTAAIMLVLASAPAWNILAKEIGDGLALMSSAIAFAYGIAQLYLTVLKIRRERAEKIKGDD